MQIRAVGLLLPAVAALVAAVGPASGQPAADEGRRLLPIASQVWPEDIIPGRVLLEDRVTVETTGTVVDVVSRIAAGAGRDWLLGVAPDAELAGAPFSVTDEPAWVALDRLRKAFGYDWGYVEGAIVCWPAMLPQPDRETPAALPAEKRERQADEGLSFPEPTELAAALEQADTVGALQGVYVYPHPELTGWRVAGALERPDCLQFMPCLGAALGATADNWGAFRRLVINSHRRLDAAIRFLDAGPGLADLRGEALSAAFSRAVPPLLCAQQWTIMRDGRGVAEMAFRELPTEVAAMVVARVRERAKDGSTPFEPDWSQVQRIKVTAKYSSGSTRTPEGWANRSDLLMDVEVPAQDGSVVSF